MMPPSIATFPLLVSALAMGLMCVPAMAKPKAPPQNPAGTAKKSNLKAMGAAPAKQVPAAKRTTAPASPPATHAKKTPPALVKKSGRQTEGDRAGKAPPPQPVSLIADPEELLARVPTSGPLGEENLILLAIADSPVLQRRRADIATARAEKRAVQDLENPELRLSYGSQTDDSFRRPHTETTFRSDVPFPNTGYREIERIITPHRNGEDITINTYDVVTDPNFPSRNLIGTTYERQTTTAFDGRDSQYEALVRFRIPHRFEKKARIQRAAAEIVLAEGQYLTDEDKLVREVRDLFETLAVLESTLSAQEKRRRSYDTFRTEMLRDDLAEFAMDATRARVEMTKALIDVQDIEADILRTRAELAGLCGLPDPSRIHTGGRVTRRVLDVASLDSEYLVEMAMLYRADAVDSRGRLGIAKALLAEADARKIPWFSFIDAGFTRQRQEGRSGEQDEWMVRFAIELPIFEWTKINKRSAAYREAAAEFERQMEKQRKRVATEVGLAIHRLRGTAAKVRSYEGKIRRERGELKASLGKLEANLKTSTDIGDYSRVKRFSYDVEDLTQQMEIGRYEAWSDYNKALMALEDAIGVRIEKALNGSRAK